MSRFISYDESDEELQNWCKAGRLMKFQVGLLIVLHDACIYRISLVFGRKSRTVSLLYGVAINSVATV